MDIRFLSCGLFAFFKPTIMIKIALSGMHFYAFHGYYDFERRVGTNFIVDVELTLKDSSKPASGIHNTINYEEVYNIVHQFMQRKYKLLESLAHDIAHEIKSAYEKADVVKVRLSKLQPPLPGKADKAFVEITIP